MVVMIMTMGRAKMARTHSGGSAQKRTLSIALVPRTRRRAFNDPCLHFPPPVLMQSRLALACLHELRSIGAPCPVPRPFPMWKPTKKKKRLELFLGNGKQRFRLSLFLLAVFRTVCVGDELVSREHVADRWSRRPLLIQQYESENTVVL